MKKSFFLITYFFIFSTFFVAHAQIVTSKKSAIKKGIYEKPVEAAKVSKPENIFSFAKAENHVGQIVSAESKPIDPKTVKKTAVKKTVIEDQEPDDILFTPENNYLATQLINNAMQFVGVRYRSGGTTISGMDCSGFVTAAFGIFDLKLPRSSIDMSKVGAKISPSDAKKGDLIFFRTHGGVINHVGMVVEVINDEIKFLHSSVSRGVMVSSTKESYYKRAFVQVNEVLKN